MSLGTGYSELSGGLDSVIQFSTLSSLLSTAPQPGMRATALDAPGSMLFEVGGKWGGDPGVFPSTTDPNYITYMAAIAAQTVVPSAVILIGTATATAHSEFWSGFGYSVDGIPTFASTTERNAAYASVTWRPGITAYMLPGPLEYRWVGPESDKWNLIDDDDANSIWTGFGDSITSQNYAFSLNVIQNLGMRWVGLSGGTYGQPLFGYAGKRSDEVIKYLPLVIASGAKNVIVMLGTNNAGQNTSLSVFYADMVTIYSRLKSAGIRVFGVHIPPGSGTPANIFKFNTAISAAGRACGVRILSPWEAFANPTTGALVSGLDATHPTPTQAAAAAAICVQQIKDGVTCEAFTLSSVDGLVSNPCFVGDANSDGLADGWSTIGTGLTFALVPGLNGNKQRIIANIASGAASIYQGLPAPVVGNKLKLTGIAKIVSPSNACLSIYVTFKNAGNTGILDQFCLFTQEAPDITLKGNAEFTVPVGAVTAQLFAKITVGGAPAAFPAVCVVELERLQLIDLTALGLA